MQSRLERPLPRLREPLRALYFDLDREPEKLDPGAHLRTRIARLLLAGEDPRDVDIALRAVDTYEKSMGADSTSNLRALGLKIIAFADPDLFPYVGAEHINDSSVFSPEPANTALQLLAASGHEVSVYQWIVSGTHEPALIEAAIDLLHEAPAIVMSRCLAQLTRNAIEKKDEPLLTKLAETIVERELEDAYASLPSIMGSAISKELYGYLALLLAGTNRPALLAMLEEQLEAGHPPQAGHPRCLARAHHTRAGRHPPALGRRRPARPTSHSRTTCGRVVCGATPTPVDCAS